MRTASNIWFLSLCQNQYAERLCVRYVQVHAILFVYTWRRERPREKERDRLSKRKMQHWERYFKITEKIYGLVFSRVLLIHAMNEINEHLTDALNIVRVFAAWPLLLPVLLLNDILATSGCSFFAMLELIHSSSAMIRKRSYSQKLRY